MTITPEQAQALLEGTTPAPWVYDSDYECIETVDGSTVVLCNTDLAVSWGANPDTDGSLAAQAPIMAEQIAGMTPEFCLEVRISSTDEWNRISEWQPGEEPPASLAEMEIEVAITDEEDESMTAEARVLRRYDTKPEAIN